MEELLGIECPRISLSSLDGANSEEFQEFFFFLPSSLHLPEDRADP
jgi:hypothetical protein